MKVYISADMEGVSGLVEAHDTQPGGLGYETGKLFMTEDINAAIRGVTKGGATQILVNDAHGPMRNVLPERLDEGAALIRGKSKPLGMLEGLDKTFDAVVCIGFHARAGKNGVLSHSFMGHEVEDIWLDETPVGEIGLLHAAAASLGVPVVFLSGDDMACNEMKEWDDQVTTVVVKKAIDRFAAELTPLATARQAIETASQKSMSIKHHKPSESHQDVTLRIRWQSATVASHLSGLPSIHLIDDRTIEVKGPITSLYRQLYIYFKVAASLSGQQPYC